MEERIHIQNSARIPYNDMQQVLYQDLTLTLTVSEKDIFYTGIKECTTTIYTINKNSFLSRYTYTILNEVHYLGLALCTDTNNCKIQYVWPVKEMTAFKDYFTFELDKPLKLQEVVHSVPSSIKHSFKLTTLGYLQDINSFNDIKEVYQDYYIEEAVSGYIQFKVK